jgi:beta-glucosidase
MTSLRFPDGFVWGTATAAYQIEGAVSADGRGPSIWDDFCAEPGRILAGDTGDVACDHYHRVERDLDLMASLGLPAYRFSVAWPRVIPDGTGEVNAAGLAFYDRLVDGLLERGITPLMTLYHWDLPSALQRKGGWADRDTATRFADYAGVVAAAVGDRVPTITTLNEPWCTAFLGHATGVHAPGVRDAATAYAVAHHLNLAHGLAVAAMRSVAPASTTYSVSLNLAQAYPAGDDPDAAEAVELVDLAANRIFLDPLLRGHYPDRLIEATADVTDWSFVREGDLGLVGAAGVDVLGVNFYSPSRVGGVGHLTDGDVPERLKTGRWVHDPSRADRQPILWPGTTRAVTLPQPGPYTDMGWRIHPPAFYDLLMRLSRDYPSVPMLVTENGCAYPDTVGPDGQVHDAARIDYLRQHLAVVHRAISDGADVQGYYLWSFMDNFEWALGYARRFGIVHVDYDTQARTPKDSAAWYSDVIGANAVPVD